jgi:hypothetical protein
MTNPREEALQTKESESLRALNGAPSFSVESHNAPNSSLAETNPRPRGTEVWRAVVAASRQVPQAQKHAFVVQV